MLLDLVRQYQDLIQAVEVERFRVVGTSYELKAVLLLRNGSQLFVKDYRRVAKLLTQADHSLLSPR